MTKYTANLAIKGRPTTVLTGTTERKTKRALFALINDNGRAICDAMPSFEEFRYNTKLKAYEFFNASNALVGTCYLQCENANT